VEQAQKTVPDATPEQNSNNGGGISGYLMAAAGIGAAGLIVGALIFFRRK
jgi:LPXTG-motif cell wall-anchored protein